MSDPIHLSKAHTGSLEERYVLDALRSGWVAPLGPHVDAFEAEVAERIGVGYGVALSSGTAALHLALLHLGARPGTVVLVPTLTFAASANAVIYTGAEPAFVDCQASDGNIDPHLLAEAVDSLRQEGRDVVAAMTVDLFGRACDYASIVPELSARGVPLIEDAAEALGATYDGKAAGAFGQAAAISFNGNKIITTSGGGMLLSDDKELVNRARKLATQAREPVPWYEHNEVGYNYRLSNVLAALGRAQLSRLPEILRQRQVIAQRYRRNLASMPVSFFGEGLNSTRKQSDNGWLTAIRISSPNVNVTRIVETMNREGIEVRHIWKPLHLQRSMADCRVFGGGNAVELFAQGLVLPSSHGLTADQVDRVSEVLSEQIMAHSE